MAAALALFCVSFLMCFDSYVSHNLTFCEEILLCDWMRKWQVRSVLKLCSYTHCCQKDEINWNLKLEIFLVSSRHRIWLSTRIVFYCATTFNSILLDVTRCVILHKFWNIIVKLKKTQILKWVLLLNSPKIMLFVLWNDITLFGLSLTSITLQSAFFVSVQRMSYRMPLMSSYVLNMKPLFYLEC